MIISFSTFESSKDKVIYDQGLQKKARFINPYLIDAPEVLVESRNVPICDVSPMIYGNKPTDGGNFILTSEEKDEILKEEPSLAKWIHPYIGSVEFINNKIRYCFWLKNISPSEIMASPILLKRVKAVREMRLASSAKPTQQKADTPHLFFFISQPESNYLLIPRVSSQNRHYVPVGFLSPEIIASDACSIIPNATLFHFGILTSIVHMAWMRVVSGRLKSDYRYSGSVVYNNFPWPTPTEEQKAKIGQTAQAILDARANLSRKFICRFVWREHVCLFGFAESPPAERPCGDGGLRLRHGHERKRIGGTSDADASGNDEITEVGFMMAQKSDEVWKKQKVASG